MQRTPFPIATNLELQTCPRLPTHRGMKIEREDLKCILIKIISHNIVSARLPAVRSVRCDITDDSVRRVCPQKASTGHGGPSNRCLLRGKASGVVSSTDYTAGGRADTKPLQVQNFTLKASVLNENALRALHLTFY